MNTNNIVRKTAAFALLGMCAAIMPLGAQTTWTGDASTSDWNTAGNWTNDVPSDSNQPVTIAADGANVTMSAAGASRNLWVSGNGTTVPILNITQNLTNNYSPIYVGSHGSLTGYAGTINHTQGIVSIGGPSGTRRLHIAALSAGSTSGNSGIYNFGGAEQTKPTLTGMETGVLIGRRPGETGLLSMSGYGNFSSGGAMVLASINGTGELRVKGGNLSINLATGISAGTTGFSMAYSGGGLSVINATIDSTGFSTINIGGDVEFGGSNLLSTQFNLDLDNFAPTVGSTFTILSATGDFVGTQGRFGNVANNDILTVDGIDFRANYNTGSGDSTFELTVIPEPSTLVLFGGAGLACLALMRRRKSA